MALPFSTHAKHPVVWTLLFAGSVMNLWCLYYFIDEGDHSYIGDHFDPDAHGKCAAKFKKPAAALSHASGIGLLIDIDNDDLEDGTGDLEKDWEPGRYIISGYGNTTEWTQGDKTNFDRAASGGVRKLEFTTIAGADKLIVERNPSDTQITAWMAMTGKNFAIVPGHCILTPHICSYATPDFKPSFTRENFKLLSAWNKLHVNTQCLIPDAELACTLKQGSEGETVAEIRAKLTSLVPPPSSFDSIVNLSIAAASIASAMFLLHLAHVVMSMLGMNTDKIVDVLDSMAFRVCQVLTLATIFVTIAFVYTTALTTVCFDTNFQTELTTDASADTVLERTRHDTTLDSWGDASAGDVFGVSGLAIMYLSFAWMYALDLSSNVEAERTYQLEMPQLIAKSVLVTFLIFQFGVGVQYMVEMKALAGSECDTSNTKESVGLVFFWVTLASGLLWALVVLWRMLEPKIMGTARSAVSTVPDDAGLWTKILGLDTARKVEMCALVVRTLSFPAGIGCLYMSRIEHPTCPGAAHAPSVNTGPHNANTNDMGFDILQKIGEDSWMVFSIIMVDFLLISYVTFLLNTTGTSAVSSLFFGHHK